jgi:hypothetical protein
MSIEFSTYKKFIYKDDALEFIEILKEHRIDYQLANNSSSLDSSFGGDINTKQFELKILKEDFPKLEKIEEELVKKDVENIDENYYLFDYSDEDLIEIVMKKEEWNKFASLQRWATKVEVVVFPCVPAIAMQSVPSVINPRTFALFRTVNEFSLK